MIEEGRKRNIKLIIAVLVILFCLITGWILYILFGHQLIRAIYEGRSIEILNKLIKEQNIYSLKFYFELADKLFLKILVLLPTLTIIFLIILRFNLIIRYPLVRNWLESHTDAIDAIPDSYISLWIALAAGICLYAELMIIRLHSSYFQLFAYFKNLSLLSCFLGLGIGYARGAKKPLTTPLALPLFGLQIVFIHILRHTPVATLLQNPILEQVTLGVGEAEGIKYIIIVYCFLMLFFTFNALCFVPLGQLSSRLMSRRQKLVSYSWNLIGSLAGILLFSLISFTWAPPFIWIILVAIGLMMFFHKDIMNFLPSVFAIIVMLVFLAKPVHLNKFDVYSPYQILTLHLLKNHPPILEANNTYYQKFLDLSEENVRNNDKQKKRSEYYALPYYFKPKPKNLLIVGSGTGNDVAAAIRNGAVEIDPAILQFGKELHPEFPYQASNVTAIVNDARAFIRHTDKLYDLIVYGLLDSHTLLSGMSGGIRLDSYVYTIEGFREARHKLKKNGIMSLSFAMINDKLGRKLFLMLQEAFDGQRPVIYQTNYDGSYTFLAGDGLKKDFLYSSLTVKEVTAKFADSKIRVDKSTDDWPFFYMPVRKYPNSYVIIILLLLTISIGLIRQFVTMSKGSFSLPCFFLGCGFMLVETKGITELALVYGSTWVVTSIVITAILIMAFLANLLIMRIGSLSPFVTYGLLFITLITGLGLTFINSNSLPTWLSGTIITTIITLPLFFSGLAFSAELKRSASVAVALSSNLLGAMLGGFLEYNSMYFGFRSLYFLALIVYGFAFFGSIRVRQ